MGEKEKVRTKGCGNIRNVEYIYNCNFFCTTKMPKKQVFDGFIKHVINIPKTLKYCIYVQGVQSSLMERESASLASVGHPSSDGVIIKVFFGVDVLLHLPILHPI